MSGPGHPPDRRDPAERVSDAAQHLLERVASTRGPELTDALEAVVTYLENRSGEIPEATLRRDGHAIIDGLERIAVEQRNTFVRATLDRLSGAPDLVADEGIEEPFTANPPDYIKELAGAAYTRAGLAAADEFFANLARQFIEEQAAGRINPAIVEDVERMAELPTERLIQAIETERAFRTLEAVLVESIRRINGTAPNAEMLEDLGSRDHNNSALIGAIRERAARSGADSHCGQTLRALAGVEMDSIAVSEEVQVLARVAFDANRRQSH